MSENIGAPYYIKAEFELFMLAICGPLIIELSLLKWEEHSFALLPCHERI